MTKIVEKLSVLLGGAGLLAGLGAITAFLNAVGFHDRRHPTGDGAWLASGVLASVAVVSLGLWYVLLVVEERRTGNEDGADGLEDDGTP